MKGVMRAAIRWLSPVLVNQLYRSLLGRDASRSELVARSLEIKDGRGDFGTISADLVGSDEYGHENAPALERQIAPHLIGALYRGILSRAADPESLDLRIRAMTAGTTDLESIARDLVASAEFRGDGSGLSAVRDREPEGCTREEADAVFTAFRDPDRAGRPGFITNFMGGITRTDYVDGWAPASGAVEGDPIPGNAHGETLEWVATLRSVLDADDAFTMLELGAGWAPWCAIGFRAARRRGIDTVQLVAIEADAGHVEFVRRHLADNDVPDSAVTVLHGIVGAQDGTAEFPRHKHSSADYGGAAAFADGSSDRVGLDYFVELRGANVAEIETLPCYGLSTVLSTHERIDLVHCDIQGAEASVLPSAIAELTRRVRRVVVGTHSFAIDRDLAVLFARHGWTCEGLAGAVVDVRDGTAVLAKDGCQVWRNLAV